MDYKFGLENTSSIFYVLRNTLKYFSSQMCIILVFFRPFHLYMEARITNPTQQLMAQTTYEINHFDMFIS